MKWHIAIGKQNSNLLKKNGNLTAKHKGYHQPRNYFLQLNFRQITATMPGEQKKPNKRQRN